LTANEIGHQRRHSVILALGPAILDREVAALDEASFLQAPAEAGDEMREGTGRRRAEKPHHRHCCLLRARRQRPRCRAAEQRDELATLHLPAHSITRSARVRRVGGMSRPIAFAVLRLMTSSNFVGCSTGSSAGLAPFRIRSTYSAARRN